jgi:phage terminase large subunit-like protein
VVAPPADGASVVVAIDGTYKRTTAVVGCHMATEAVFLLWAGELATDDEIRQVVEEAAARWDVLEVTHHPTIRADLMAELGDRVNVVPWSGTRGVESQSANMLYQAITDGTLIHDGHALLARHFANLTTKEGAQGLTLRRASDEQLADAAMAARMAWWRAKQLALASPAIHV